MAHKFRVVSLVCVFTFLLTLFSIYQKSFACQLGPTIRYPECANGQRCIDSEDCIRGLPYWVNDFGVTALDQCVMGYLAGYGYHPYRGTSCVRFTCNCNLDPYWNDTPSYEGQPCIKRWGLFCDNEKEGVWDSDSGYCVICQDRKEVERFDCGGDYPGDNRCESACGADPECDEKYPYSYLPDICGEKQLNVSRYCDGSCEYSSITYTCDSSHACDVKSCGGQTYYCVYDSNPLVRRWKWSTSIPSGFCCKDNDCPGYDPATHTKYVCECPNPNTCSITGNSYTCKPKPLCKYNSECDSGWCCNADPALPTDCKQPTGSCVAKGEIMCNSKYICDPPEGFVSSSNEKTNTQANKKLTLLDLLTNPFSYFFIR